MGCAGPQAVSMWPETVRTAPPCFGHFLKPTKRLQSDGLCWPSGHVCMAGDCEDCTSTLVSIPPCKTPRLQFDGLGWPSGHPSTVWQSGGCTSLKALEAVSNPKVTLGFRLPSGRGQITLQATVWYMVWQSEDRLHHPCFANSSNPKVAT